MYPDPETGQYQLVDNAPLQEELAALAEYQYIADTVENHDDEAEGVAAVDEQEEEEVVADAIIVATPWAEYHAYGREPSDPFEGSESVPQPRKPHKLSDFVLGWGLYCIVHGVSRKQYAAQLQLLKMLGPVEKVRQLPESLDTLKRHVRESLPHIDMRTAKARPLNPKKLSSSRIVTAIMAGENPTQDLFFLNPVDFLARIQGSQLAGNMHYGMAELVDQPTELWHSMQWAGSVRTTSGEFAYYPPLPSKEPIFPGDIVDFECTFFSCKHCHSGQGKFHIGQVIAVYRDRRQHSRSLGVVGANPDAELSDSVDQAEEGDVVLLVARVLRGRIISKIIKERSVVIKTNPTKDEVDDDEWVLSHSPMEFVPPAKVSRRRDDIGFDYAYGSAVSFPDDPRARLGLPLIRRVFLQDQGALMPPCLVPPVPGVLEVTEFSRDTLIEKFVLSQYLHQVRSLPCLNFNDGFGLYRTMTKSIMGCYLQIAAMPRREHTRQINVLPVTLGPHGANLEDVMKALMPLKALDRGTVVDVNGVQTLLCAPIIAFTGDMPQQQDNSGCLGVVANFGCRGCKVPADKRGDLDFDVLDQTRAHMEMLRLRRAMDDMQQKYRKQAFSTQHGLSIDAPAVQHIAPALDLISGRPSDTAHSEFNGITKMTHQILLDAALKPESVVEYSKVLRRMPFPPGWARIQSPYNVLKYSLQEHARWSVLMTIILLLWLKETDIKRPFVRAMKAVFSQTQLTCTGQAADMVIATKVEGRNVVEILTIALAAIVKTNSILSSAEPGNGAGSPRHVAGILETILVSRRLFQLMCEAASRSTNTATGAAAARRRGATAGNTSVVGSRATSRAVSPAGSEAQVAIVPVEVVEEDEEAVDDAINIGQLTVAQKATKYRQWAQRPNVHVGLHYIDVFRRYGLASLLMVLPGELKHK